MVAATTSETWDAAWTLTMRAHRKRLTDNISDSYPTLGRFRKAGVMEVETGGKEIQEDLMYGLGSSEWFDGFDVLSTNAVDGITAAFYQFRYNATSVVISDTEDAESRKAGSTKLITAKSKQAMTKSFDTVNSAIFASQSGKSMLGSYISARRNFGSVNSSDTLANATSTRMPISRSAGLQSTISVTSRTPSSISTTTGA